MTLALPRPRELGAFAAPLLAIAALYQPIFYALMTGYGLPEDAYEHPVILAQALRAAPLWWWAGWAALIALGRDAWRRSWSDMESGKTLRIPVGLAACALAWYFSTYDYNLYFDQSHLADRALLLCWAALSLWKPLFLAPLVFHAAAVMGQFQHPLAGYHSTHPVLLIRLLALFLSYLTLRALWKRIEPRHFITIALVLIAASYLRSGAGKLLLLWPLHGHVYHLLFAAYSNGWWGFLEPATIEAAGAVLRKLDWLIVISTLALELGVALIFWSRRAAAGLLLYAACFHVGVFAMSGICFWQWVVLDGAFAWLLLRPAHRSVLPRFDARELIVTMALIVGGVLWFRPAGLNWLDTRINYAFRFEGVGEEGQVYELRSSFFAPYEYEFHLGFFQAYVPDKRLDVYWGSTMDRGIAQALMEARTPDDIRRLEGERGFVGFNEPEAARIDGFLTRWVDTWNRRGDKRTPFSVARAPLQLWTYAGPDAPPEGERLRRVDVYWVTSLYDESRYQEFRRTLVRTIEIGN